MICFHWFLGRQGVYNESSGLKIAYLSGIQQEPGQSKEEHNFNHEDVRNLHIRLENEVGFRGVDIFLTTQWPAGVQLHAPPPVRNYLDAIMRNLLKYKIYSCKVFFTLHFITL